MGLLLNRHQWLLGSMKMNGVSLDDFIDARLAALMLATFKNIRAARPQYRADSYDDAAVYLLKYAKEWHKKGGMR